MDFERRKFSNLPPNITEKWSAKAVEEGYVPFPKKFLRCLPAVMERCRFEHLQVVLAIADYRRPELETLPSMSYLAFIAGLPEETFRKRLSGLRKRGLVKIGGHDEALRIDISGLLKAIEQHAKEQDLKDKSEKK